MRQYPIYLQDEEMACGAYCILMILKYHGYQEEIQKIKDKTRLNQSGITIKGMIECFKSYQIEAKAYEASLLDIQENVTLPCILYTVVEGIGHFVVLYEIKDDMYTIGDPAQGLITLYKEELEELYCHRMISITHVGRVPQTSYLPFHQYLKEIFFSYKKVMMSFIYKGVWISLLGYLSSYFYQILIDLVKIETSFFYLVALSVMYGLIEIIKTRIDQMKTDTAILLTQSLDEEHVFQSSMNLLELPYSFFYQDKGYIQSQLTSFYQLTELCIDCFERLFLDIISFIIFFIGMLVIQPLMVIVVVVMLVCVSILAYTHIKKLQQMQKVHLEAYFHYQHHLLELIDNHFLIRCFSLLQKTRERSYHMFLDESQSKVKQSSQLNIFQHHINYIIYFFNIIIMILGFYFFKNKVLTLGQVLMFYMLMSYCIEPLLNVITVIAQYQQMNVIYEKYKAYIPKEESIKEELHAPITSISLDNVGYAYGYRTPIFEHIDLGIDKNLLLQGCTGSGKSTLLKLIMGYDMNYQGDIYINDQELKTLDLESVYKRIGYMDQTPTFLHMSLFDNFLCDDEEKITTLLKLFHQEDLIDMLSIVLDEQGMPLSRGQRQVVGIIRLILQDYDVYILDEAFSHMDQKLSNNIQRYLFQQDGIFIVVNHQTKVVKKGWDCAIIEEGKLIKKG